MGPPEVDKVSGILFTMCRPRYAARESVRSHETLFQNSVAAHGGIAFDSSDRLNNVDSRVNLAVKNGSEQQVLCTLAMLCFQFVELALIDPKRRPLKL